MASNNMYVHLQEEPADVLQEEPADVAKKDTGDTVDVAMDNINRFLGQLGLVAKQVPGDNNCGYHAIADLCNPEIVKSDMDTAARATRKVIRSTLSNDSLEQQHCRRSAIGSRTTLIPLHTTIQSAKRSNK